MTGKRPRKVYIEPSTDANSAAGNVLKHVNGQQLSGEKLEIWFFDTFGLSRAALAHRAPHWTAFNEHKDVTFQTTDKALSQRPGGTRLCSL